MPKVYNKPPLTFKDQLTQLEKRGLQVHDHQRALSTLSHISYYRLSGYWHQFRKRNTANQIMDDFISGASFEQAVKLYDFDSKLRLLVLDAVERIEVSLRNQITYFLAHKYGAFGYINPANFHPNFYHAEWLENQKEETLRSQEDFISHFKVNYDGFPRLPVWMATEVMSFGVLSKLFNGLKNEDKREIAKIYHLHPKTLADWLHVLTYIRNICAHHSRLWNKKLAIRPNLHGLNDLQSKKTWLKNSNLLVVFVMINQLLQANDNGADWRKNIEALFVSVSHEKFIYHSLGVSSNWQASELWLVTS